MFINLFKTYIYKIYYQKQRLESNYCLAFIQNTLVYQTRLRTANMTC